MIDGDTKLIAHIGYPTASFRAPQHIQSLVRTARDQRGGRAAWRDKRELPRSVSPDLPFHQFPRRPHHHAAQGHSRRLARRSVRRRARGRRLQRRAPKRRRQADRRHVRRRRLCSRRRGRRPQHRRPTRSHCRRRRRRLGDRRGLRESRGRGDRAHRYARGGRGAARRAAATELPRLKISLGTNDPSGFDVAVNATPLGTYPGDPLPMDPSRLSPSALVGEVVLKPATTAFLAAAKARGLACVTGLDMLFEQIPAYLEFFGFPSATAAELRETAEIKS